MPAAPLHGLRVLELATGVAGPYAGRLLGMLGATVVKAEPAGGDPARDLAVDDRPAGRPSPLFVHLNAGKRLVGPAFRTDPRALAWADMVVDDEACAGGCPARLHVSVPAGPDAIGGPADELLVQAASGLLDASRDDDGEPLRFPGWQTQYLAGVHAAGLALAALARGAGHVEVSWSDAATMAVEAQAAGALYAAGGTRADDPDAARLHAGFLTRTFPSGAFACADGHVVPGTVRPSDWYRQCEIYDRPDLITDTRFVWARRWDNRHLLRAEIDGWYAGRPRAEIVARGLDADWAVAPVLTARDALTDPHLRERGFLAPVNDAAGGTVIARPWRAPGLTEAAPVRMAGPGEDDRWFRPDRPRAGGPPRPPDLSRLRVVELTWAWSGPMAGKLLGLFGADVVRVESGRHPDGWRTRHRWGDLDRELPPGTDPDEYTWDAAAQFNSLNRNKRSVSVDLSVADGRQVFLGLLGVADVLLVNMNHRILADRGLQDDVAALVDRGLVVVTMPACGATGPNRAMAGYGMLTEGTGGFAARYGRRSEGARTSRTYYPDAVAGLHGHLAVLATLCGRAPDGPGAWVDLSQQETMWLQLGEGIVLASREGRDPVRLGMAEPGTAGAGVRREAGVEVAHVTTDRARTATVESVSGRYRSGDLADRDLVEHLAHPAAGTRAYLAVPGRVDDRPLRTVRRAPTFDEHTDEVLDEWLGLPAAAVAALRAAGAVGTRPPQPRRRTRAAQTDAGGAASSV